MGSFSSRESENLHIHQRALDIVDNPKLRFKTEELAIQLFSKIPKQNPDYLSSKEFAWAIKKIQKLDTVTEQQLEVYMKSFDEDNDGRISLQEFQYFVLLTKAYQVNEKHLKKEQKKETSFSEAAGNMSSLSRRG